MTEELVNLAAVERALVVLAVGLPLVGIAAGLGWGVARGERRAGALRGLAAGLLGPLVWVLWKVFNAIEDHFGLDSVTALLINLALFAAVGVAGGILLRALSVKR